MTLHYYKTITTGAAIETHTNVWGGGGCNIGPTNDTELGMFDLIL